MLLLSLSLPTKDSILQVPISVSSLSTSRWGQPSDLVPSLQERIPFAVVGADREHIVNGRCVLGRKTKWGIIEGQCRGPGEGSGENMLKSPVAFGILTPTTEPSTGNRQTWDQVPLCSSEAPGKFPNTLGLSFLTVKWVSL